MSGERVLGVLGGMAWPSTADAYRLLNEEVARRRGGLHSARVLVWSFDFAEVEALQAADDWAGADALLVDAARRLVGAGADGLMIATNTMHRCVPAIASAVDVPVLHIADATAAAVRAAGVATVGLLGTRYTMEGDFYRGRLERHGLAVVVPDEPDRTTVHDVIYDELVRGEIRPASRDAYRRIAARLVDRGATGIIAGCTEIELLLQPDDVTVAYFPTTRLHVLAAADWLLGGPPPASPTSLPLPGG